MSSIDYRVSNVGSLSVEAFRWVCEHVPKGGAVLELGSGEATRELIRAGYSVTSIEHDAAWVARYGSRYIHAPLRSGWYDVTKLGAVKDLEYDLIIVDGPPACTENTKHRRLGFLCNLDLFDVSKPMLVDDCQRVGERRLLEALGAYLKRPYELHECGDGKVFGVV